MGIYECRHHIPTIHDIALDNDTRKKLACLLSQILQGHCADLNAFLKGATLQSFANKMCEAGIITVELRDNPRNRGSVYCNTQYLHYKR